MGCGVERGAFAASLEGSSRAAGVDLEVLHRWADDDPGAFWSTFWPEAGLLSSGTVARLRDARGRYFPDVRLSYARNLIDGNGQSDDAIAVTARHADGRVEQLSRAELRERVWGLASALRTLGLAEHDRVALVPRSDVAAVVAVLAVATVGATVALCSPEMGTTLMLGRLRPLAPKLLLAHAAAMPHDVGVPLSDRIEQLAQGLPSLQGVLVLDGPSIALASLPVPVHTLAELVLAGPGDAPAGDPSEQGLAAGDEHSEWPEFAFDHPLFITASESAEGELIALVHGAGGVLLEQVKEHRLHLGLGPATRLFAPASVASALWLWQLSALASGAGILLYDGPVRDAATLWRVAAEGAATVFVSSAAYVRLGQQAGLSPANEFGLAALQALHYTGMTLDDDASRWVQEQVSLPEPLQLGLSPELLSCLLLQRPGHALAEAASRSLGLGVYLLSCGGEGSCDELVCTPSFPSRPLGRWVAVQDGELPWQDAHDAYLWASGMCVERDRGSGDWRLRGRIDAVMEVRGTRVLPAELLPVVRSFDEVREAVVVEQALPTPLGEGRAVLLLVMRDGHVFDAALVARLRRKISEALSPSHVPDLVLPLAELPRDADGVVSLQSLRDAVNNRARPDMNLVAHGKVLDALRHERGLQMPAAPLGPQPPPAPGWRSRQDHEAYLRSLWERVLGLSSIGLDDDFFELGGHSLLAARIVADIQRSTDQRLATSTLLKAPTIRQLAAVMDRSAWDLPVPLVRLRAGDGRPFFLVHSLAGTFLELWAVLRALDTPRPVYGLQARAAGDEHAPYMSVPEMAADYIVHMRRLQPTGPYAVGGYSFGGLVAFEIAQQLQQAGETVELVTLIDTHVHGRYLPLRPWLDYCVGWLKVTGRRVWGMSAPARVDYLKKKMRVVWDRLRVRFGRKPLHPELVGDLAREANFPPALRRVRGAMLVAMREYEPSPYPGRVLFLRSTYPSPGDPLPVWRRVAQGGLEIEVTPGDHDEMITGANAAALAAAITRHL